MNHDADKDHEPAEDRRDDGNNPGRGPVGKEITRGVNDRPSEDELAAAGLGHGDWQELVDDFRREFAGSITGPDTAVVAAEMLEWFRERFGGGAGGALGETHQLVSLVKAMEYFYNNPNVFAAYALCICPDIPMLRDIVGNRCMAEEARLRGVSKEAVRKWVEDVQREFGFPKLPEQRTERARGNMREARTKKLRS